MRKWTIVLAAGVMLCMVSCGQAPDTGKAVDETVQESATGNTEESVQESATADAEKTAENSAPTDTEEPAAEEREESGSGDTEGAFSEGEPVGEAETDINSENRTEINSEVDKEINKETVVLDIPDFPDEAFFAESDQEAAPIVLTVLSEENNNISQASDWMEDNGLSLTESYGNYAGRSFYDDTYYYNITENQICIYDRVSEQLLYEISFQQSIGDFYGNWASLDNGILYLERYYNGYASPDTCYLMAMEADTGNILWRSEDQTCNSRNFIVKEDVIICGYGFTAEPDYIYQIDKKTGRVVSRTDLAKMADYLIEKDGKLYAHTYDRDYVFSMKA